MGGHGPYWFATQTMGGRTVEKYVGKRLPAETQGIIGRKEHDEDEFVGRQDEVERLMHNLAAINGTRYARKRNDGARSTACVLTGETGIGKTRLAEEVTRLARQQNWSVVWIGITREKSAAYHIWAEILRTALAQGLWKQRGVLRQQERYAPLRVLLPDIFERWPPQNPEQLRLWECVHTLLSTICARTALLIVLDDLHWADDKSHELLAYLLRQIQDLRIFFLCSFCEQEHPQAGTWLTKLQEQATTLLPLAPLSPRNIADIISHLPADLAKSIVLQARGNPLFAKELARSYAIRTARDATGTTKTLPTTLSAVLAERLAPLTRQCQSILENGAVLGDGFSFAAIRAMSHIRDEELLIDLLEEATQAEMLLEETDGTTVVYHFWHPLLQTYLYEQLSATRRINYHRRAAEALRHLAAGRDGRYAAQIIRHLTLSDADPEVLAHYTELAADHAYSLSAYQDAARFYQQVLRHVQTLATSPDQQEHEIRLLELLGECVLIQGEREAARAYYDKALRLHQQIKQGFHTTAEVQAMLWVEIGLCWFHEGNLEQAAYHYERGETCLREADITDGFAWGRIRYEQSYQAMAAGRYEEAYTLAHEALTLFETINKRTSAPPSRPTIRWRRTLVGDPVDGGRVHSLLGVICNFAGRSEEALTEHLKAYTIFMQHHQIRELAIVCCNIGDIYLRHGAYEQASEALEQTRDLAQRTGERPLLGFAIGNLGIIALRQEDLATAESKLTQAIQEAEQCNDRVSMSYWEAYAGRVALARNNLKQARRLVAQALISARGCQLAPYLATALVSAAYVYLVAPDTYQKAYQAIQRVLGLAGIEAETRIEAQLLSAQWAALAGDPEQAGRQAQVVIEEAVRYGVEWLVPFARRLT